MISRSAKDQKKKLSTKAETLLALKEAGYRVPDPFFFELQDWNSDSDEVVRQIRMHFPETESFAIRSSRLSEDSHSASMAGAFLSILDVPSEPDRLKDAIGRVVGSYGGTPDSGDQVLVQPMLRGIVMSGVLMTRVLEDGSPYYSVNYDDESGKTDSVTGGGSIGKTVFVFRNFRNSDFDSPRLRNLLRLARQLEAFFGCKNLDIEFAMTSDLEYHVFQVRPIAAAARWQDGIEDEVTDKVSFVEDFLESCNAPRPGLAGRRTILGVMPDWNPAEIVGLTPRPLAASLYRYVVTQGVWREARAGMGYRKLPPEELMILVAGRPYIDVRASFNSFLPEGLPSSLQELLVDAWLDRLDRNPSLHDKVEFEIVPTVLDFGFHQTMRDRYPDLLSPAEFRLFEDALLALTLRAVSLDAGGSLRTALDSISALEAIQERRGTDSGFKSAASRLIQAKSLLEECKELGTRPFAIVARHAFIAESFLRSAIGRGAWNQERYEEFKASIRTVSGEFGEAHAALMAGRGDSEEFFRRFGHLRPGTYDILTPTYRESREKILAGHPVHPLHHDRPTFRTTPEEESAFRMLLEEAGLGSIEPSTLLEYARIAIAGREKAKFVFTRNLSDAIESIAAWGACHSFGREDVSWLSVYDILNTSVVPVLTDTREHFLPLMAQGRRQSEAGRHLKLGFLIRSARDVYIVPLHRSAANFVTKAKVTAPVARIGSGIAPEGDLQGKIICIENADPGYDWLFGRGIAGLVTKFGGTNSHMAIRCSEYGIPAAIGCGEAAFARISAAANCEIDADAKILRAVEA